MNWFRTCCVYSVFAVFFFIFWGASVLLSPPIHAQSLEPDLLSESEGPLHPYDSFLFADIDTLRQKVYVFIESGLWSFDLSNEKWQFLDSLKNRPDRIENFQFGYNPVKEKLQLWSNGIGQMYEISLSNFSIRRIDQSHNHRNQYGHAPFFHNNGSLFGFGGYGYWSWKNILTFYNYQINEWNVQPVDPNSEMPPPQAPIFGTYHPEKNSFFLLGGTSPKEHRQDDQYTEMITRYDYWSFDFDKERWNREASFNLPGFEPYNPFTLTQFSKNARLSITTLSTESNTWYFPLWRTNQSRDIIFLTSLNVHENQLFDPIKLNFGVSRVFLPASFLYNNNGDIVFVGIDYLSHQSHAPIRLYSIPEDTIHAVRQTSESGTEILFWGILILIVLTAVIITFRSSWHSGSLTADPAFSLDELDHYEWMSINERKLLRFLAKDGICKETQEIEEYLWPDISNYDYRRRLRNDLLKSLNHKIRQHTDLEQEVIFKKPDPSDRRKKLYGIHPAIETGQN
ncbi:hypothetical protein [Fodinibius sediminis]|uniref:Uncharacterized protein n=1 Tax=Fodinibius sediminis TaxID=1214077 RepID=A0A521ADB0_9BACT|nr:hypothetical protein [Fodinibius sediminis]SMO32804.1 hypothetical protein SAMN06265218_10156 [Fodinibius sediminis]